MNLATTTLIMLVAPSAIGKSTIMNCLIAMDSRFSRVRSFTTRAPRPNDELGHYIYLTREELADKVASDEVVSQTTYPTTGEIYGTLHESYRSDICILDTLANSVAEYRALPFQQTITISATTTPEQWRQQLIARYPKSSPERHRRLDEARLSIEWSLADTATHWLINNGSIEDAAAAVITIINGMSDEIVGYSSGRDYAHQCLAMIDALY
jgi:guanylate kinase